MTLTFKFKYVSLVGKFHSTVVGESSLWTAVMSSVHINLCAGPMRYSL